MMKWLIKYQNDKYKKTLLDHGNKRKKEKNQSMVIELQRLKEFDSHTRMKIKEKIIMVKRNSRALKVKAA